MIYERTANPRYPLCVVKDLSNGAAKISLVTPHDVPDRFTLRLAKNAKARKCRVLGGKAQSFGVEFVDMNADKPNTEPARKTRRPVYA